MGAYVDGYVLPVPKKNVKAYQRLARAAAVVFREHGALSVVEAVSDDIKPGKLTSFPRSVKLREGEVVVFSWITYKSRVHRDRVNAKVILDPRIAKMMKGPAPFDSSRMIFGGFKTIVQR
jgi:uncharacterized protein YbaA (DUF1428 family)